MPEHSSQSRHLVSNTFQVVEELRTELREYSAGDKKLRIEWFEKNRVRTCDCCRTVFVEPVPNWVCPDCQDHLVCTWCVNEFEPGGISDGLLCQDPDCHTEFGELWAATLGNKRRRGDKVREEYEEATFRKACPHWQGD